MGRPHKSLCIFQIRSYISVICIHIAGLPKQLLYHIVVGNFPGSTIFLCDLRSSDDFVGLYFCGIPTPITYW